MKIGESCPSGFKPKSVFNPHVINSAIDTYEKAVINDLKKVRQRNRWGQDNLSKVQREALKSLKDDDNIVIVNPIRGAT